MKINITLVKKIFCIFSFVFVAVLFFVFAFYLLILPKIVKSEFALNYISKIVQKTLSAEIVIDKPSLKTSLKPEMEFEIEKFILEKDKNKLVELNDFEIKISFNNIFKKEIMLEKLEADKLEINLDELISILPTQAASSSTKNDFKILFNNSDISLDEFSLKYLQNNNELDLNVSDIKLKQQDDLMFVLFDSEAKILKDNSEKVLITAKSNDEIKLVKDELAVDGLVVKVNNSIVQVNAQLNFDKIFLNFKSKKFYLDDVFKIISSDLFIPNGEVMLMPLKNPKGSVAFDINMANQDLSGSIIVNDTSIELKDVSNIPIKVTNGKIKISKDKIDFVDMFGYYGKNKANKITIKGDIKDYYKTFDSNIVIESLITNEFFKDYLAKLINNTELFVSKPSRTKILYKSKNNIMDIIWFAQIDKGVDFGVTTEKSALSDYDRAVLGEFNIKDDKIDIKNINYYIASNIVRGVKLQPILQMNALMDFSGKLDKVGFAFGREMPCEFLNVFVGEKIFKKGTIKGNLNVVFKNDIPYLDADMQINKTLIPSQRIALKHVVLNTNNKLINIDAQGRFKKASFNFNGKINNELKPPFVIKKLALDVDNLDVERILNSFNNQNVQPDNNIAQAVSSEEDIQDDDFMFDTKLIRIEDCNFTLANGNYKDLTFGNISAKMTLDEKGILNIQSNKFDIADGISTLKVVCDLQKLKYYIRLGVKEIDSNLMAKTLFNLDKEITGAATGLIELNGDESLKLNGDIKFVVNNGTIGKIGLVEYILKIASVFRNPVVMVSPATIMDIISIPEGKFDKISGAIKIKDNVLAPIDIKSYSSSLSALIKGKFDLERHDASLRIYTRFSTDKKSMFGILRNLSLNSLANKVKMNSKNDANYYESELVQLPQIEVDESKTQVFLTQVEGDIEHYNFLSSLKRIK
ncbi:hypothetical protein IJX73_02045 [bacterium]|nr:hypothetical protein [bacterium]MBQ9149690.1 hypothetical protein [bacterium]